MSHYAVLGLDSKATEADIKKAYRKKARDSHPDKNPNDPNAAKKFMKIKEAYDFLSNNAKRAEYDNKQAQEKRDAQRWAAYQVIELRTTPSLIWPFSGLYISLIAYSNLYLRLGLDKGAHELLENEFRNFLKSADSALESLEL